MEELKRKIVEENKALILNRLQELVRIPSVLDKYDPTSTTPFGKSVDDALNYMLKMAKEDGFETYNDNHFAGVISYGEAKEEVGILCHLDVVPEGKGWLSNPFSGMVQDGFIYGRGTQDDKGPTIAAYMALKFIKDLNIKLKKQVKIILGTDEESGWRGIHHYLEHHELPKIGFAPDANFPLIYGEKGRLAIDLGLSSFDENDILVSITGGDRYNVVLDEVTAIVKSDLSKEFLAFASKNNLKAEAKVNNNLCYLTLHGVAFHAMEPQSGINAGTYMCEFLKDYSNNPMVHFISEYLHLGYFLEKLGLDYNDYEMERITCNIGIMNINKEHTRVTLDMRYPTRYDIQHLLASLKNYFDHYQITIDEVSNKDPHYVSPDSQLVQSLYNIYLKHTGDVSHKPFTIGGGTYASLLKQGVAYGMLFTDDEALEHQANEKLKLESLYKGVLIYMDAIIELGGLDA